MKKLVRVPLSQLKEESVHRLTQQVQIILRCETVSLVHALAAHFEQKARKR